MENIRVTVVTPSYNQGEYIEQAIRSVVKQTYANLEYIVIDACSEDETRGILRVYAADIDRILIEPDRGQADAINKGFGMATGDLIGWLNCDDVLLPGAVEKAARAFRENATNSIFYGSVQVVDAVGTPLYLLEPQDRLTYDMLLNGRGVLAQQGSFYPRKLVKAVGGVRSEFHIAMDRDLWLRLLQVGDGVHIGGVVALFRHHRRAKSSEPPFRFLREIRRLNSEFRPRLFSRRTAQTMKLIARCVMDGIWTKTN